MQKILYYISRASVAIFFKLGWRHRVEGVENVPRSGAAILAANHRSYADPPLVGSSVRRPVHFLAKEELFRFRPFGWLITNLNAHPLKRGGGDVAAFRVARNLLLEGNLLIVFPEGRRSPTDELAPPRAGIGLLASISKCPVIPVYVHNSGHMKKFRPLLVRFGTPISPDAFPDHPALAEEVMRRIAVMKDDVSKSEGTVLCGRSHGGNS